MKRRIFLVITVFFYFILIFLVGKVLFIATHSSVGGGITTSNIFEVLYHGLPLDMSMSGYLTALPALVLIASIWIKRQIIAKFFNVYYAIVLSVIAIITVADIVIYSYWGFHFDSTVFLYLQKPKETFASVSAIQIILSLIAIILFVLITFIGYKLIVRKQILKLKVPPSIAKTFIVLSLLTGLLFLPIRGGVSVSTMNVGRVYFSDNIFLNHAAINPEFNLMYSFTKSDSFASQYQFYDKEEAIRVFKKLNAEVPADSVPKLLNTDKPNVILFVLESFSARVALDSVVSPNISRYAKEGILFSNFYANTFRTDRGLVSIMSGYPAHPTVAIMKYPQKTESLPTITRALKPAGYTNLSFYYGGDADFANMRSYIVGACGIGDVVSDKNFPVSERLTKWGAPDKNLVDRLYIDLTEKEQQQPFFKTVFTLSSHEPFDVPVAKFDEPFLNAIHYTDGCIGSFIDRLKTTEIWNNTLIILIADHTLQWYAEGADYSAAERFHIPMIWTGGAVKQPMTVSDYSSQNDLAATLLSQLGVKHDEFSFSKDILNPGVHKFAFYSYFNGFSMTDTSGTVTFDNDMQRVTKQSGNTDLEKDAKAFFQMMYMDLGSR